MRQSKNIHYDPEEKMDIMRKAIYETPDEDENFFGLLDSETCEIARLIDDFTFAELRNLAKAIRIISQGKVK